MTSEEKDLLRSAMRDIQLAWRRMESFDFKTAHQAIGSGYNKLQDLAKRVKMNGEGVE